MRLLSSVPARLLVALLALPIVTCIPGAHADEPGSSSDNTSSEITVVEKRVSGSIGTTSPSASRADKSPPRVKVTEADKMAASGSSTFSGGGSGSASAASGNANPVSTERLASAIGHYARARALIISAVNEFDQARKLSDPNPLLDGETWRNAVIDRAEDLERVLDPQPRTTRTGVRFDADPRLLGQDKSNP